MNIPQTYEPHDHRSKSLYSHSRIWADIVHFISITLKTKKMQSEKTKTIYGTKYVIYESGMKINDSKKSYYFEEDLNYDDDIICLNFYACKNAITKNQVVSGDQVVRGKQDVSGDQVVNGNQVVRYLRLYFYTKWAFFIDRDTDIIKIGCKEKSISDWQKFFAEKQTYDTPVDSVAYKKIECGFKMAVQMKEQLTIMNIKNDKP